MNNIAIKSLKAMAHAWPVTVELRTRPVRKIKGVISQRRRIEGFAERGDDGESNLEIVVGGETVALMRVADIRRQRLPPAG